MLLVVLLGPRITVPYSCSELMLFCLFFLLVIPLVGSHPFVIINSYQLRSFLVHPCSSTHNSKCAKTMHPRIRRDLGPMIRQGEVNVYFYQPSGRGPWWISVTKLKKKAIAPTSPVPRCHCGIVTCELNIYQRKVAGIATSNIDQNFVDGLKESKKIFSLRTKGQRPEPEVEYVEPPPKPQAEVVDLIE